MTTAYFAPPRPPTVGEYAPPAEAPIGKPGQPIRALAFSGGLFDSVMQLGVAHALLVSRAEPPDVAVGVSTGAVNAVALAEILQAGSDAKSEREQVEAQVARFREVLEAYRQSRDDILPGLLPDVYQVDAQRPLRPTELPIHSQNERDRRGDAARSRAGLISLANYLLRVDLSIAAVTRATRALLGLRMAPEIRPLARRIGAVILESFRLWVVFASNLGNLSLLGSLLLKARVAPFFDWLADLPESKGVQAALQEGLLPRLHLSGVVNSIVRTISSWGSGRHSGSTAGGLVFRSKLLRRPGALLRWLSGFLLLAPITLLPPVGIVALAAAASDGIQHLLNYSFGWRAELEQLVSSLLRRQQPVGALHWNLVAIGVALIVVAFFWAWALVWTVRRTGIDGVLKIYRIDDSLLDPHAVRTWLVRLFDPFYYGRIQMPEVVEAVFAQGSPTEAERNPKIISSYSRSSPPIHVRPIAANVQTGQLDMLPGETPVVDGLLAATALPPLFEAQQCGSAYYIDGSSVANEPTRAVLMHLTNRVNDLSTGVDVYPVASLPIGKLELPAARGEYLSAVDIAKRAIQLESFRDATLDRRMTVLLSRTLPGSQATWSPPNDARDPDAMTRYLRASVYPIELDTVNPLNGQMFAARTMEERRGLVASAVADGCRSSLEVMLASTLRAAGGNSVKCRAHLASRVDGRGFLPGSDDAQDGSGLPEVCRACVLHLSKPDGTTTEAPQSLRVPPADTEQRDVPLWPTIGQPVPAFDRQKENSRSTQGAVELDRWPAWPLDRISALETPRSDRDRPTISLLFSGGVFRGVYLAGVINGLNEVRVQPDVIAGSSIGSITAAMAARVFAVDVNDVSTRQRRILDVAATYLAVDRLVLTDRFSDFVRNFTLRSAAATFSLRSLDRAFRAFDRTTSDKFGRDVRRVLAGLERLFYVSPFEAHDLIRAFRLRDYHQARLLIEAYSREWLERGAVGVELLGAEPLAILIREHVLDGTSGRAGDPAAGFVDLLRDKGIQFICTATNLTLGRLDTLHIPSIDNAGDGTRLVEALLASSAFPGVFRPRWSWELRPEAENVEQYIDGGVMDNLPLDAVASFLNTARNAGRVRARPRASGDGVPHLLFTGSLEIASPTISDDEASELTRSWRRTRKRSKELTYNNKIDNYAKAQHALRRIYTSADPGQRRYEPLDLEVVAVKPQWLCGTFAFHPMLGFRRADQAKSIAHGCKTTLNQFATLSNEHADWLAAWNVAAPQSWHDEPDSASKAKGHCWYRKGCVCPFSDQGISGAGGEPIKLETRRALRTIYEWCGKPSTHERDP